MLDSRHMFFCFELFSDYLWENLIHGIQQQNASLNQDNIVSKSKSFVDIFIDFKIFLKLKIVKSTNAVNKKTIVMKLGSQTLSNVKPYYKPNHS